MSAKRIRLLEILLVVVLILDYFFLAEEYSRENTIICLLISLYFTYSLITYSVCKIRPLTFFLFAYIIVNWQIYIDLLVGNASTLNPVFISPNTINKGVILSTLGLSVLSFGYYFTPQRMFKTDNLDYSNDLQKKLNLLQIFCFVFWLTSLSIDDFTGQSYLSSGSFDNTKTGYENVLFNASQILSLTYFVKTQPKDYSDFFYKIPKVVIVTSFLYVSVKLMSGDRGGAIYTIFLYFSTIIYTTKRNPKLINVVVGVLIGAFVMTSISFSRGFGNKLSFYEKLTFLIENKDVFSERYQEPTILPPTRELANSVICTHIAIDEIENKRENYHYGKFHFTYVLTMIPFVGSQIISLINVDRMDKSSSEYVTVKHNGEDYMSGLGTTIIADNYLEYGLFTFIIAFLFYGYMFKIVDDYFCNIPIVDTPAWLIIVILSLCCYSISIPRAYFLFYVKHIFYAIIMYRIIIKSYR